MILDLEVTIKISPVNYNYWKNKGYDVEPTGGRAGINNGQILKVKVADLASKSNVKVKCRCNQCGREYIVKFSGKTDICYNPCLKKLQMKGNNLGIANKGRVGARGPASPRWNPNKGAFIDYATQTRWLSELAYREHKHTLNPQNLPRTLCGVAGGYQLDHKVSIKEGFEKGIPKEQIADVTNLQLIPWQENRRKAASPRRIHARKCNFQISDKKAIKAFLAAHHRQGAPNSFLYGFALFYKDEMVACLTYALHHRGNIKNQVLVLSRLCFPKNVIVIGGASKLFKNSLALIPETKIISWSDRRYSKGDIYKILGFQHEGVLRPDYAYIKDGRVYSKQSRRKSSIGCPPHVTEHEFNTQLGFKRIWDMGKDRWMFINRKGPSPRQGEPSLTSEGGDGGRSAL